MATVTKGKTFISGETVEPADMHQLVDSATVTNIVDADISASAAIAASKLAGTLDLSTKTITLPDSNVATAKIADAAVTAPKLSGAQTGSAPIYGARAWVNFNGTTAANLSGTYSQSGTTVTVTATAHGHKVGHAVCSDITSGTAVDGTYIIATVPDANTFTYTADTSLTTSGNVTLTRRSIRYSANVNSVVYRTTGLYIINFETAMPSANYAVVATSAHTTNSGWMLDGTAATGSLLGTKSEWYQRVISLGANAVTQDATIVNVIILG